MQQDNERQRMEEEMKQQQDRRSKPMQAENHQQPQQPQKCPRCESLNTKFCYYNNYSLSQPRYFCKTCRRYWTQGGTLRNVPVGGGCRKGKRTKTSNSGDNSRSQLSPAPLIQQQGQQNMGTAVPTLIKEASNLASPPQAPPPAMSSYYSGGGFLSSLAVIQSLNQNPQGFNQSINVGGGKFGGSSSASSNMALLQGFNVPTFSSQQHHHQQQQQQMQQNELIFQMGNREKNVEPLFPSQDNWNHPNLINTTNNSTPSEAGLWNINSSSSNTTSNSNSSTVGASMNPYQWPDLPGYGPPP